LTSAITANAPPKPLRRIDFNLKPYMASDDRIAAWQIANTIVPLTLSCLAIANLTEKLTLTSLIFTPILYVLIICFLSRSFSLMHDCGHHSLFKSKHANRIAAFALSIIHAMPHHPWSRGHAFHHKHNGNWDRYRGPSALTTVREYEKKSKNSQFTYQLLRHPLVLIPGGFYYLVIKPRATLVAGLLELVSNVITDGCKKISSMEGLNFHAFISDYKSDVFHTKEEAYDTIANSVCVALAWWWIGSAIGYWHFWILYGSIMSISAAIMIAVFFVQHNFPGSYASGEEDWSFFKGAIEGSSFLIMPRILNWFTADIAYHHIHHLSERIPNYRLRTCHQDAQNNFDDVKRLELHHLWQCFSLILWDNEAFQLVSTQK
jgi:omega-6 fatty acid desaturase (delta-12 desaturase)